MKHEQALAPLLGPFMRQISRVHLVKGEAADEISKLAASEDVDVLVMGTMCRTGIAGWLIGNTAETVLDHIECSLVALKPPGFVSPICLTNRDETTITTAPKQVQHRLQPFSNWRATDSESAGKAAQLLAIHRELKAIEGGFSRAEVLRIERFGLTCSQWF